MIVVTVVGLDWQEQCLLAVAYEIEMDRKKLDCSVPMQVIKNWSSWRNTSAPIIEEISAYCKQVGVISPFQEQ
jgi:hypothetical protein